MSRFWYRMAAVAAAAVAALPSAAAAVSLEARYGVTLVGLPVGSARLKASFDGDRYVLDGYGKVQGLSKLVSSGKGSAQVSGRFAAAGPLPTDYRQHIVEDDGEELLTMRFADAAVAGVSIEPDRPREQRNRVPLTDAHRQNVIDPLSALLLPAAGAGPALCDRTLPVFDGRQRFDLALAFSRTETVAGGRDGYSGPAQVCSIRYRPVAGHKRKKTVAFMADNRDMEIWFAPVGTSGAAAPVRISIRTMVGQLTIAAERFRVR